jgi:hypothetical protein
MSGQGSPPGGKDRAIPSGLRRSIQNSLKYERLVDLVPGVKAGRTPWRLLPKTSEKSGSTHT